jgi:hypothetical protein
MSLAGFKIFRSLVFIAALGCGEGIAVQTASVSWTANTERDVVSYRVYYRPVGATAAPSVLNVSKGTTVQVPGLLEGRSYVFYVTAVNSSDVESIASAPVTYSLNSAPTFKTVSNQTAEVGLPYTLTGQASDADAGQLLTYALLSGAPAGAAIDSVTGTLTWTPAVEYAGKTLSFGIQATDNGVPARSTSTTVAVVVQAPDSDLDGIPDWYERQIGLNPREAGDAELDSDGDGFSNQAEFDAGTDPTDPASFLHIFSVQPVGNDVAIQFTSVSGKQYRVEATQDPEQDDSWTLVGDRIPGNGSSVRVADTGANLLPARFYRVILLP